MPRLANLSANDRFSLLALLIANLYPIAGVYIFGWDAFQMLMVYWAENLVIGVFVILKLALRVTAGGEWAGAPLIPFFAVHYGAFCLGHGLLLLSWFGPPDLKPPRYVPELIDFVWPLVKAIETIPGLKLSLTLLALGQLANFVMRYVLPCAYLSINAKQLMWSPYPRIITLHVAMLIGAVIARKFGEPAIAVVLLIVIKTVGEVWAFLRSAPTGPVRMSEQPVRVQR